MGHLTQPLRKAASGREVFATMLVDVRGIRIAVMAWKWLARSQPLESLLEMVKGLEIVEGREMVRNGTKLPNVTGIYRTLYWMGVGALGFATYPACGNNATEERLRAAKLAESCSLDSECKRTDPKLVCKFGYCHQECEGDEDCRQFQGRCVQPGICQLADEISCEDDDSKCTEDGRTQTCADDGQCRDSCNEKSECISGLECSVSGFCARPRELDADGELLGNDTGANTTTLGSDGSASIGGSGGTGDASSSGGTSASGGADGSGETDGSGGMSASGDSNGSGETDGSGGTSASGGSNGSGETDGSGGASASGGSGGNGGTGNTAGAEDDGATSGSGGVGGSGGTGAGGAGGGPVVTEQEPNNLDDPDPLPVGVEVSATIDSTSDHDYFEISVPDAETLGGGYFEISIVDVGECLLRLSAWTMDHDESIFTATSTEPADWVYGYFAAAADQHYVIEVEHLTGGGLPCDYKVVARYTFVDDPFEPNDTLETASDLNLDESVQAYLFAGYETSTILASAFEDWYAIDLAEGPVSVQLSDIPVSISTRLYLHGPPSDGVLEQRDSSGGTPKNELAHYVTEAGTYYVRIGYNMAPSTSGLLASGIPAHFSDPYTLFVTQSE